MWVREGCVFLGSSLKPKRGGGGGCMIYCCHSGGGGVEIQFLRARTAVFRKKNPEKCRLRHRPMEGIFLTEKNECSVLGATATRGG